MEKILKLKALAMCLPVLLFFLGILQASSITRNNQIIDTTDTISTQSEFDAVIKKASLRQGVDAYLKKGTYTIEGSNSIYTKFILRGESAVLKQKNKILTRKDAIKETASHFICPIENLGIFSLFVDAEKNIIPISEEVDSVNKVNFVTEDIISDEPQNSSQIKKIKIKIPDNLKYLRNQEFEKAFGYIDSWYTSPAFAVTHTDSNYFYCNLLLPRTKEQFNTYINGEKYAYKENPALVIYNITPKPDKIFYTDKYIYIPKNYDEVEVIDYNRNQPLFMPQENAELRFENLEILNSNYIVFPYKNFIGGIAFEKCNFRNILQYVVNTAYNSDMEELYIGQCEFLDCALIEYLPLIRIFAPNCSGKITHCIFNQYTGGFCFYKNVMHYLYLNRCREFNISDNIFVNNPRGALFLLNGKFEVSSNEFYNDSIFNSFPDRNFSRDAGAIYCNKIYGDYIKTKDTSDKINLRFNKIHDFYGKGDVRGIFIDDGRGDVTCYGNLIFNGQLYSIDSRVSATDPYSSIRNKYQYNILSYPYRLMYGDSVSKSNRPILKNNILLYPEENKVTTQSKNDIRVTNFEIDGSEVKIDNKVLKKLPKEVRKMFKSSKNLTSTHE